MKDVGYSVNNKLTTGGKEKDHHNWQQAEAEATHFIEALTLPNSVICDPFAGSGTTCVAAKKLNRQWIAFEVDEDTVETARGRIADY